MAIELNVRPANFISLDLFPAKLTTENGTFVTSHEEYRVIVTDNAFYLFDDTLEGPQAVISDPLVSFDGDNKTGYTVTTETDVYHIERALNCGCGSRLRGLHPFAGVPYAARKQK